MMLAKKTEEKIALEAQWLRYQELQERSEKLPDHLRASQRASRSPML